MAEQQNKPYKYECKECGAILNVDSYNGLRCTCDSENLMLLSFNPEYPAPPYNLGATRGHVILKQLYGVYESLLHVEDTDRIDAVLAVALSSKIPGIRLWLIVVGPSGDMKSVQLNAIRGNDVVLMHNLTSKSLVNGFKDKKKYPDLAPQLDEKIVVISDMAQILKLPPNEKGELWGQLRDLYDGYAGRNSGMGSTAKYEGLQITLLAGSTAAIDGQILVHQDLGTRELIYRTSGNEDKNAVMDKCIENEEQEERIGKELKKITREFLDSRQPKPINPTDAVIQEIKNISSYVVNMRCTAEFDNYTHELRNYVYPEEPTRITKQLKKLYVSLKNLDDNYPDEKALRILWHVGKSCAFPVRVSLFDYLREVPSSEFSTSQLSNFFHIGKATVKRECQVLEALGLVKCRRQETSYPDRPYEYWQIDESHDLIISLKKQEASKQIPQLPVEKPSKDIYQGIHSNNVDLNFNNNILCNISLDGSDKTNLDNIPPASATVAVSGTGGLCSYCNASPAVIFNGEAQGFCKECAYKSQWSKSWEDKA